MIVISGLLVSCNTDSKKESGKDVHPNILFIAVDDLRPELGTYGVKPVRSPNIDRLAAEGLQFNRAYCNIPVCGASRASILTGTRPTRNTWITYHDTIRDMRPDAKTLGKWFRENGYYTIHNSKVMHHPGDAPGSWNEEWWPESIASWRDYVGEENLALEREHGRGPAFERLEVPDTAYKDGKTAAKAIRDLEKLKKTGKPFFLATGFVKPHLPFNAPEKYWALYDSSDIVLPQNTSKPENAPGRAMHNWGELRSYYGIPGEGPLSGEMAHKLKHGYYACVSYTDAQVGKILDALEELELAANTIVVLWGDHGWNLREHGLWCKHCNFETSLHAPLIMKGPGIPRGKTTGAITEFVDIYPTLCEMAGLKIPEQAGGNSLLPLISGETGQTDGIAVCRWKDGYTIIRDSYFYTAWMGENDSIYTRMLYDHRYDPNENRNISVNQEHEPLMKELYQVLLEQRGEHFDLY